MDRRSRRRSDSRDGRQGPPPAKEENKKYEELMKATQSQEEKELSLLKSLKSNLVARAKERMEQNLIEGEKGKGASGDVVVGRVEARVGEAPPSALQRNGQKGMSPTPAASSSSRSLEKEKEKKPEQKKKEQRKSSRSSSSSSSDSGSDSSDSSDDDNDKKEREKKELAKRQELLMRHKAEEVDKRKDNRKEEMRRAPEKPQEEQAKGNVRSSSKLPPRDIAEPSKAATAVVTKVVEKVAETRKEEKVIPEAKKSTVLEVEAAPVASQKKESRGRKADKATRKSRSKSRSSHG